MRKRLLVVFAATVMLFAFSGPLYAAAEPGDPTDGDVGALILPCDDDSYPSAEDTGGYDSWARCWNSEGQSFSATFQAYGEWLVICDYYPNGARTQVDLHVYGYPKRTLESRGTSTCLGHNLAYPEGLSVKLYVCDSKDPYAVCHWGDGGRT
ncbi:hypothetical protein [Glycomyces salinus]|uniref:hypothetical protein n=1 Tax=Glycomyces salinus TaxID=980294 RepID=UPI0018EE1DDB|nr:hypothetical protein [Glycomyces salinus]